MFLRGRRRVGYLDERLSQDDFECLTGECSIGNVVADAFVDVSKTNSKVLLAMSLCYVLLDLM